MSATIPTPTQTLSQMKTTELRQLASKVYGIKGMSSARKDDLVTAITAKVEEHVKATEAAQRAQREADQAQAKQEAEAAKNARKVGAAPKTRKATDRPKCEVCGKRRVDRRTQGLDSTMCQVCYEYAGEENRHTDQDHEGTYAITGSGDQDCPVCQDAGYNAKRDASAPHAKALRFEADAKAAGWNALARTAPAPVSSTEVVTSIVTARKGDQELTIIWDGASCRNTGTTHKGPDGKVRKVRNASAARKILASV